MKRLLLLMVVVFSFATTTYGQNFFGGLILGGTTSQVQGDDRGGFHKIGITGGAFAGLHLSEDFDVQMELKYIQKGSRSNDVENRPGTDPFLIKLDYIDLPIVFTYNLNKMNINDFNMKWMSVEFGLSLDVLLSARQEIVGVVHNVPEVWRRLALNALIGVRFTINENFDIGIRSVNALTSNCKTSKMPYSNGNVIYSKRLFGNYGMYNDVLQLSVFWKI